MNLTIDRAAEVTGGEWIGARLPREITGVSIDSRAIQAGDLFVAIRGERLDGHDFLAQAALGGAAAALVSRSSPAPDTLPLLRVGDTLLALHALARHVRGEFAAPVVGVTGSTGKTTTKDFTAALLSSRGPVLKTEGNLNNQYGVPLTLLRLTSKHTAAVIEMGMSAPGELRVLTGMVRPDVALITNVAPVHLEFFDSLEAIARAKAEILEGLSGAGFAAFNRDDPHVRKISAAFCGEIVWFGEERGSDVRVVLKGETARSVTFALNASGQSALIALNLPGRHAMMNFTAAAAVAYRLGVPFHAIAHMAEQMHPAPHRGELLTLGRDVLLVDDSYNSNPAAVSAAVAAMGSHSQRRRVAFLGDMLELGARGPALHEQAGETIGGMIDALVTVGPLAKAFADGARRAGMDAERLHCFEEVASAAKAAAQIVQSGDVVLVKGSRGVRMEGIVNALIDALGRGEV